ncbi:hypothetical protein [Flavivirga algicola]|uniref:DUF1330 domain-containing protein n=1 Tax=Flavivirga algicola TaxID=2729136 RepID=A0ABX1RWQ9_9FLAO|nr:hypothetical protein [Flavivirga algicola]NMH86857.1 hypothetical protein [Flavivirga algicola]
MKHQIYMIDFVVLNDGFTIKDRNKYEKKVIKITKKYGMKIQQSYKLNKHMKGDLIGAIKLNIWILPNANVLKELSKDEDYLEMVAYRNEIHNMNAVTIYMAESETNLGQLKGENIFVDLVVMNDGYGNVERDVYEDKILPVAENYGMHLKNVFNIREYKMGMGPKNAIRLNIWEIEDPKKMKELGEDKHYIEHVPFRNKIHNMSALTLYLAEPI